MIDYAEPAPAEGSPGLLRCQDPLALACGAELPGFELAYETYGQLNAERSNAVLVCPALNASHALCGRSESGGHIGWWNSMVGPGKPIDTSRFFVVGVANLGGNFGSTGTRSIDPSSGKPYGGNFPFLTVRDWVVSQERLATALGIGAFAAVVGGSLGGMQALQWAISYPSRLRHAILIASAPSLSAQNIAFNEVARQAILNDPDFREGRYENADCPRHGLRLARMLAHINYSCGPALDRKFGRMPRHAQLGYDFEPNFEIESYLHHQARKFASYFDADYYLRITKALDYFDPARDHGAGELWQALRHAAASFLVIAFTADWRFEPSRSQEIVQALRRTGKQVDYREVSGPYGHDGFLLDDARYHGIMRARFDAIARECSPAGDASCFLPSAACADTSSAFSV